MSAAERVSELQEKLYCKAKQERGFKFYILYDKMYIGYMLEEGYRRVKAKDGSAGVDGQEFKDIEAQGIEKFLKELGEELRKRIYKPSAVKRVWIEKANGGKRPIGIPKLLSYYTFLQFVLGMFFGISIYRQNYRQFN